MSRRVDRFIPPQDLLGLYLSNQVSDSFPSPKGYVKIRYGDEDGIVREHWEGPNMIVFGARQAMSRLIGGDAGGWSAAYFALGTGGHDPDNIFKLASGQPSVTDTDLEEGVFVKELPDPVYISTEVEVSVTWTIRINKHEANSGTPGESIPYTEAGIKTAEGVLLARDIFEPFVKTPNRWGEFEWKIRF